jgi:tetratricopeptide (TPR) repeat protein
LRFQRVEGILRRALLRPGYGALIVIRWLWLCVGLAWFAIGSTANAVTLKPDERDCIYLTDPDQLLDACGRVIGGNHLDPQKAFAYFKRSTIWNSKREFDKAISDLSEAIRLSASSPLLYNLYWSRGEILHQTGEFDRAISDYTEAIRLNPKFASGYMGRGTTWLSKGEIDRAISDYNSADRLSPKDTNVYMSLGYAWAQKGELDRAIAANNEAIRFDRENAMAYNNRALVWFNKGDFDRAIADEDEATRLLPKSALFYTNRGRFWQFKGDLNRALADLDRALELEPRRALFHVFRGDALRYKGEFARAIADYEQALLDTPDFIPAFTGLGLTYQRIGDLANARAKFEHAASSQSSSRFIDVSRSSLETARAQLAALDAGAAPPTIPISLPKAASVTAIPTPMVSVPAVSPAAAKASAAKQGRRVALVIGNSAYKNVAALSNPQRDAETIAASLRAIGFESVTLANDVTHEKLIDSLRVFASEAENADWAMVYYAGHGIEVAGVNYLVPVDARLAVDRDIEYEAIPLSQVLKAINTAKKIKLVMLDACRNNPFAPRKTEAAQAIAASDSTAGATITSRSINGRGLAEVKVKGATLVVFAAKDGQVALDGEGADSPFAVAVVQRIATPGGGNQQTVPAGARRRDGGDRRPAGALHLRLAAGQRGFFLRQQIAVRHSDPGCRSSARSRSPAATDRSESTTHMTSSAQDRRR